MSCHHARLVAGFVFLAVCASGCVRWTYREAIPHVYPDVEYLSEAQALEHVKAGIAEICYTDTLDPFMDTPNISFFDRDYEAHKTRCRELKARALEIQDLMKRMQALQEEAEAAARAEGTPERGRVRFGDGPLEPVKK